LDSIDASYDTLNAKEKHMLKVILSIYNMSIYGVNNYYVETFLNGTIQYPPYISPNIVGRAYDFILNGTGIVQNAIGFFALSPNDITYYPEKISSKNVAIYVETFSPRGPYVFTQINYYQQNLVTGLFSNATSWAWWRFDDKQEVLLEYDEHGAFFDTVVRTFLPASEREAALAFIRNNTCLRYVNNCLNKPRPYATYANYSDCMIYLASLPEGTPGLETANSQACRWWNSYYLKILPDIYCETVGPTGGPSNAPRLGPYCKDITIFDLDLALMSDPDRIIAPTCYVAGIPNNPTPCD